MIGHFEGLANDLAECSKNGERNTRKKTKTEYEDSVVARFLQSFEDSVTNYARTNPYNVNLETHKLQDIGSSSPETQYGADYVIGFSLQLSDFEMSHGLLVQAKKGNTERFPTMPTIRSQCNRMLEWSPATFLNVMTPRSYRMYPASQLVKTRGDHPTYSGEELEFDQAFDYLATLKFYRLFFRGIVGDNWIFQNIDFLIDRNVETPNERPLTPDGGEMNGYGRGSGIKALIILVSEDGVQVDLPFNLDNSVEEFSKEGGLI